MKPLSTTGKSGSGGLKHSSGEFVALSLLHAIFFPYISCGGLDALSFDYPTSFIFYPLSPINFITIEIDVYADAFDYPKGCATPR